VRLWNLPGRVELARYAGHSGHVYAAIFSPDGRRILSGDANGEVRLWDTKAASELHCYRGHTKPISRLAFSPDGRYALSSAEDGVRLLGLPP
jgi:WD40 repeat protein